MVKDDKPPLPKTVIALRLLESDTGATVAEILEKSKWTEDKVRAFIRRHQEQGFRVDIAKDPNGQTRYRLPKKIGQL